VNSRDVQSFSRLIEEEKRGDRPATAVVTLNHDVTVSHQHAPICSTSFKYEFLEDWFGAPGPTEKKQ
jgi:hypothetical protein